MQELGSDGAAQAYDRAAEITARHRGELDGITIELRSLAAAACLSRFDDGEAVRRYSTLVESLRDPGFTHAEGLVKNLRGLAASLSALGEVERAAACFAEAIDIANAHVGENAPELAECLASYSRFQCDRGETTAAVTSLRRAVAIREALLPEHPDYCAATLQSLANLLREKGDLAEAEQLLRRAIQLQEQSRVPNLDREAGMIKSLALVLGAQSRPDQACTLIEGMLRKCREQRGERDAMVADLLDRLGVAYDAAGKHSAALSSRRESLTILRECFGGESQEVLLAEAFQAIGELDAGNVVEAHRLSSHSFTLVATRFDRASVAYRFVAYMRPEYLMSSGNNDAAIPLLEELVAQYQISEAGSRDHRHVLGSLASSALMIGDFSRAAAAYRKLAELDEHSWGSAHPRVATSRCLEGTALARGSRLDEAQSVLEFALAELTPESSVARNQALGSIALNLGVVRLKRGDIAGAEHSLRGVLTEPAATSGVDAGTVDLLWLVLAETLIARGEKAEARAIVDDLNDRRRRSMDGRFDTHGPDQTGHRLLELGDYAAARECFNGMFESSASFLGERVGRLSEGDRYSQLSEVRHAWLHLIDPEIAKRSAPGDVVQATVRWKGVIGRSLAATHEELASAADPDAKHALVELRLLNGSITREFAATPRANADVEQRAARITALMQRSAALQARIAQSSSKPLTATAPLEAVARILGPDAVALDFVVHRRFDPMVVHEGKLVRLSDWGEEQVSVGVIRGDGSECAWIHLGPAAPMVEQAKRWLVGIDDHRARQLGDARPAPLDESAKALRAALWDPLVAEIGSAKHVVICPDAFIAMVPFEALMKDDGHYLIETRSFSYVSDLASLVDRRAAVTAGNGGDRSAAGLFLVGDVDFDHDEAIVPPSTVSSDAPSPGALVSSAGAPELRGANGGFRRLPSTAREIAAIDSIYRKATGGRAPELVLTRESATEVRVADELQHHAVVHIATHGFFEPSLLSAFGTSASGPSSSSTDSAAPSPMGTASPLLTRRLPGYASGLVFAGANARGDGRPADNDGFLVSADLAWLDLSGVDLIVLSACETGLGTPASGEGLLGMRRSLRLAGARTVISSLWQAHDVETTELMTRFYGNLWERRLAVGEALRQAQLSMIDEQRKAGGAADPSTWAAFVLDGSWR